MVFEIIIPHGDEILEKQITPCQKSMKMLRAKCISNSSKNASQLNEIIRIFSFFFWNFHQTLFLVLKKGYFHSTTSMHIFLMGFLTVRQKRARLGRSGGGFWTLLGGRLGAGVGAACCPCVWVP